MRKRSNFKERAISSIVFAFSVFVLLFSAAHFWFNVDFPFYVYCAVIIIMTSSALLALYGRRIAKRKQELLDNERRLLMQSEERYRLLEEFSDDIHFDANIEEDYIVFNSSFESILGQVPGITSLSDWKNLISFIALEDLQIIMDAWKRVIENRQSTTADIRLVDAEGQLVWYRLSFVAQYNSEGKALRVMGKLVNINAQMRQIQRLRLMSMQDPLTGLYHRTASQALVDDFLREEGEKGRHALLIVDIDNFKGVNDSYGHYAGDTVLIAISSEIKKIFRSTDIIGRLGGDEFMIFLKNIPTENILAAKIMELLNAMSGIKVEDNEEFPLSCSIGAAFYKQDGYNFYELYKAADSALYKTKFAGKNNYTLYSR